MHLNLNKRLFAMLAMLAAAGLTGCASSSRTTLGSSQAALDPYTLGAGDQLGAAMFGEHVRFALAQAREQRALATEYATVPIPND
ncbi:MAG: hypothetical protein H6810_13020 [Phycisphaeraceae bacterium]|nr:MAG: hypothetical protein H6810_13020 [Phycisphaeraceae bacterium]